MLEAERHATQLAANTVRWLLEPAQLTDAPLGWAAHLKLARTGLTSASVHLDALLDLQRKEGS